jgi:hypothetical protein
LLENDAKIIDNEILSNIKIDFIKIIFLSKNRTEYSKVNMKEKFKDIKKIMFWL